MVYNFTLFFKIPFVGDYREDLFLDYSRNCRFESQFCEIPDANGYYRLSFRRLRECKIFLKYLVLGVPYGFCLADLYIVSHNSGQRLRAVLGYRLINNRKHYTLSYEKI